MKGREFWNRKIETLSPDELRKLQMKKLRKRIKYCYENSPLYYRQKFDEIGVKPEDIRTWEDFRKLPILVTKEDERASQEESLEKYGHSFGLHLCAPLKDVIAVNATSGTTGVPVFYAFTKRDIAVVNEGLARGYWTAGLRPGDSVLHAWGLSMWIAGIPHIRALEAMGIRAIPLGAESGAERFFMMAQLLRPTTVVGTPSYIEHLIDRSETKLGSREKLREFGIKKIMCAGEPGAGLPKVRERIETAFGAKLYDCAGTPWGLWNISCDAKEYQGMHVLGSDFCICPEDLIDPNTKEPIEVKDGAIGEALLTSLEQEAIPLLKYKLGDIIQVFTEPCECGRPGWRKKVIGRADDMIIVKGVNVYPASVKNLLGSFVPKVTGQMTIILDKPGPRVDPPLRIKIEQGKGIEKRQVEDLEKEIEETISKVLRFRPDIEFVPPHSLELGSTKKAKLIEKRYEKK